MICSCMSHSKEKSPHFYSEKNILDTVRIESKAAWILLHHQVQKVSMVVKMIYTRQGIDSLFKYIGQLNIDTNCLHGGLYNYFGEIDLYKDSLRNVKVAEIHFVLEGNCTGFYLRKENYLKRYYMTQQGKEFISKLYNAHKNWLK